jgi:nitrile hydratase beta subunit
VDGVHDLGGLQGFGPVQTEDDEPPFHEPWEGRVHGLMLALALSGNLGGGFRFAIERMDPRHYLTSPYYEHWLEAILRMLDERGTLRRDDVSALVAEGGGAAMPVPSRSDPALADAVRSVLRPFPVSELPAEEPRFGVGHRVRVRTRTHAGHTRCPRYVRGLEGVVACHRGTHLLHDAMVMRGERQPEPLYTVAFRAPDLWEDAGDHTVHVDLWESYLEESP